MTTVMALIIALFAVGGTGGTADGVGGTGHGNVFDGTATPSYTPPEYEVG